MIELIRTAFELYFSGFLEEVSIQSKMQLNAKTINELIKKAIPSHYTLDIVTNPEGSVFNVYLEKEEEFGESKPFLKINIV